MVEPLPPVGRLMAVAYRELDLAVNGTAEQLHILGDTRLLPRPWNPTTCQAPQLRAEVWAWLHQVVLWVNHEYVWDVDGVIPSCWPHHPHLIHEVAVLADQRRAADAALTSDPLEEWHRYSLPYFTERVRARVKSHCDDGHQPWPAKGRYARQLAEDCHRDQSEAAAHYDGARHISFQVPTNSRSPTP